VSEEKQTDSATDSATDSVLEEALAKPFPQSVVKWRAKKLTKDRKKALALAYIDSRTVMRRLDQVVGAMGWQNKYREFPSGRMACGIGILFGDEWVWKWDGAGETAVEADKGIFSDSFKRAAVMWGIVRYLYDLGATWVPCTTYSKDGKTCFKEFTADPWDYTHYRTDEKKDPGKEQEKPKTPKDDLLDMLECPALSQAIVDEMKGLIEKKQVKSWYEKQIKIVKGLIADSEKE